MGIPKICTPPRSLGACYPIEEAGLNQRLFPVGSFVLSPFPQEHEAKSKGIFDFHNLVRKVHYWSSRWVEDRDTAQCPAIHRIPLPPQQGITPAPNSSVQGRKSA